MKLLTAAAVLASVDLFSEDVPTPEWAPSPLPEGEKASDYAVRVRTLTAEGRAQFIAQSIAARDRAREQAEAAGKSDAEQKSAADTTVEATLVLLTCINEDGSRMFTSDQLSSLMQKSGAPIGRIAAVAQRLAGLTQQAQVSTVKPSAPAKT